MFLLPPAGPLRATSGAAGADTRGPRPSPSPARLLPAAASTPLLCGLSCLLWKKPLLQTALLRPPLPSGFSPPLLPPGPPFPTQAFSSLPTTCYLGLPPQVLGQKRFTCVPGALDFPGADPGSGQTGGEEGRGKAFSGTGHPFLVDSQTPEGVAFLAHHVWPAWGLAGGRAWTPRI